VTALAAVLPTAVGASLAYTAVSDGVGVLPAAVGARYLLLFRNTGGSASVPTIDDPTSTTPVGATAFNPDLVGASVPATTGATAGLIDAGRFRDASGNINMTFTNPTSLTVAVIGPL
jgi:hypothetical protein